MIKVTVLVENKTYKGCYLGEHGLSLYIEHDGARILYDAGMTDAYIKNAPQMGVDLSAVEYAVLSHGHHDHAGGYAHFREANKTAMLYAHKNIYREPYPLEHGVLAQSHCGVQWSGAERAALETHVTYTDGPCRITEDMVVSGTIPALAGFEPAAQFFLKDEAGNLYPDDMSHEQFLAIRDRQAGGVVIFSGCSHTGVVPCIHYARTLFPGEPIIGLVAGMHLYGAEAEYRRKAIADILACEVETLVPLHCTGIDALCDLKAALGERCILLNTGDSYTWK